MNLIEFPTEILIHILSYCEAQELCNLQQTCKRFCGIIRNLPNDLFKVHVTNQLNSAIKQRSTVILTCMEKFRISNNWKCGRYTEKAMFYVKLRFMPYLHLTKQHLWLSRGPFVEAYRRRERRLESHPVYILSNDTVCDVSKFAKDNGNLVAGLSNGQVWLWSQTTETVFTSTKVHPSEVTTVDINNNLILSGSRNGEIYLWQMYDDATNFSFTTMGSIDSRIWSSAFNPKGNYVAVGASNEVPLSIFDVNRLDIPISNFRPQPEQKSIWDIKWLSDNTVLTCGYDGRVRLWDMRAQEFYVIAKDPFLEPIYCIDTDVVNTIIAGTSMYGRVVLYDIRYFGCKQMYFMQTCRRRNSSSPVYSLSFEPQLLFAATDRHLNILDFTHRRAVVKDYSLKSLNL